MGIFEQMEKYGHEQLLFFYDSESGLKSVIGIHDSTLGSVLGGCRMWDYDTEEEVLDDVLKLSLGMTQKSAVSGNNHGGGKAVIWGDPEKDKSEALFRSFGRFVDGLNGRFCTGTDVGTAPEDFVIASQETDWMVGLPEYAGGGGSTAGPTAYGVFCGLRAAADHVWGTDNLQDRVVAVQGVGKVGSILVDYLLDADCEVVVTDIDQDRCSEQAEKQGVSMVAPDEIYDVDCDIFSPCAMGAVLNEDTIERLNCEIIGGAANNQLANDEIGHALFEKDILYVPDYIINAGGLIHVADEIEGYNRERVMSKTEALYGLLQRCMEMAEDRDVPPFEAAEDMVEQRISNIAKIDRIYLPR